MTWGVKEQDCDKGQGCYKWRYRSHTKWEVKLRWLILEVLHWKFNIVITVALTRGIMDWDWIKIP